MCTHKRLEMDDEMLDVGVVETSEKTRTQRERETESRELEREVKD